MFGRSYIVHPSLSSKGFWVWLPTSSEEVGSSVTLTFGHIIFHLSCQLFGANDIV
jgi:hypothetical protein